MNKNQIYINPAQVLPRQKKNVQALLRLAVIIMKKHEAKFKRS